APRLHHHAVVELVAAPPAVQLPHGEAIRSLFDHRQPPAGRTPGREKDVVPPIRVDRLPEDRLQRHEGLPRLQSRRPEVLEPPLRGFDRVEEPRAVVRGVNGAALRPLDDERARDIEPRSILVRPKEGARPVGPVHVLTEHADAALTDPAHPDPGPGVLAHAPEAAGGRAGREEPVAGAPDPENADARAACVLAVDAGPGPGVHPEHPSVGNGFSDSLHADATLAHCRTSPPKSEYAYACGAGASRVPADRG